MWSDWLVFCDCGFQSVCPLIEKDKRLMERRITGANLQSTCHRYLECKFRELCNHYVFTNGAEEGDKVKGDSVVQLLGWPSYLFHCGKVHRFLKVCSSEAPSTSTLLCYRQHHLSPEVFHPLQLKCFIHQILTPHCLLPPVAGNHDSTFCLH